MTSLTGFGQDYEAPVSKAVAKRFAGMYPLPRMGYEIVVAIAGDSFAGWLRLHLQNISGQYVLASTSCKRSEWPEIFKVNV